MAIRALNEFDDIEIEAGAALDELEQALDDASPAHLRLEAVRRLLDSVENRVIRGPEDLRRNAADLREARRILLGTEFPAALRRTTLFVLHRLWLWERFLRG